MAQMPWLGYLGSDGPLHTLAQIDLGSDGPLRGQIITLALLPPREGTFPMRRRTAANTEHRMATHGNNLFYGDVHQES